MSPDVICLGELLVEIMRKERGIPHDVPADYSGPYPSGAPAIFIDTVARLRVGSGFIGVVGDDDFGRMLVRRLREDGVDTTYIRVARGYTTGTTFVMYFRDGSRSFIFHLRHAAAGQLGPDDVDPGYIRSARALHIMGSALSVSRTSMEACYKALRIAKEKGAVISFDPNLRPELLGVDVIKRICDPVLRACTVLLPSGEEAAMLAGVEDEIEAARMLLEAGPKIVALKQGEKGCTIFSSEGEMSVPAFRVREVDPTGAGDAFDGGFVVGLLRGWDYRRIGRFANAVAGLKVTRFGPMEVPTLSEVEAFLRATG